MLHMRTLLAATLVAGLVATPALRGQETGAPPKRLVDVLLAGIQGAAKPSVTKRILPTYPAKARGKAIQGTAIIEVVVGKDGLVVDARPAVGSAADDFGFVQSTVEAVGGWKFQPAVDEGRPVASLVLVRATFPKSQTAEDVPTVSADMAMVPHTSAAARDRSGLPLKSYPAKAPGLTPPQLDRSVQPRYTQDAMRRLVQGNVEMEILILTDGTVGNARVVKSLDSGLDQEALVAARYWRFIPGTLNGEPVPVLATLILSFKLH